MNQLIAGLLVWIAAETGLIAPPAPAIEMRTQTQLSDLAYGDKENVGDDVQALYHREKGVVYLRSDWRENNPHCVAALLHELVHHVQAFNGVRFRCAAAAERQAYDLSIKWLRDQKLADPYAVLGIDKFTIAALSVCVTSE